MQGRGRKTEKKLEILLAERLAKIGYFVVEINAHISVRSSRTYSRIFTCIELHLLRSASIEMALERGFLLTIRSITECAN